MIFTPQLARKPDYYPWTLEFIESIWETHWTPLEFSFVSDKHQFKTELNVQEQEMVKRVLSAIAQIETQVKVFWARLGNYLPHPSLVDLGLVMASLEVTHNIAYQKLLEVLELDDVFEENLKLDIIRGRVLYLKKYLEKNYTDDKKQYLYSLILFTLFVENVSLFSQFYIILWLNRFKNVLNDTASQVNYTKTEESLHSIIGIKIVNTIRNEHPELFDESLKQKIEDEAVQAFQAESKIVDWMLGDYDQPHLNAAILKEFIKNRINDSMTQIGFDKVFTINDDLLREASWFDEDLLGNTSTDFFHRRPTEYVKNDRSYDEEEVFSK